MTKIETVKVDLDERSYEISIGTKLYNSLSDHLPSDVIIKDQNVYIITDENVAEPHANNYQKAIENLGAKNVYRYVLPSGEATKCFENVQKLCHWMLDNGVKRDSVVFTIGGGVVGDIGAFVSSIAMRGVRFVQVPTTLLSQVDSSVGGKTGINTSHGKNLIGTFYQPRAVLCDVATLETLEEREVKAGYAEVLKYGLINDEKFFYWLCKNGEQVCGKDVGKIIHATKVSCMAKANIVAQDERESGCRALLNLGHTFGHALEAVCGYDGTLLHGEGVSIGMVIAYQVSEEMGLCSIDTAEKIIQHCKQVGLPTRISDIEGFPANVTAEKLFEIMQGDKKATATAINFIMAKGIGQSFITASVDKDVVLNTLNLSMQR